MDLTSARAAVEAALAAITSAQASLVEEPDARIVKAGDNLQAALDKRGSIILAAGAVFAGTYVVRSDTVLTGAPLAAIRGATGPALVVLPGAQRITIDGLELASGAREVVILGANDATQTRMADVPTTIALTRVRIPTHRGKRAIAIHASDVQLLECEVLDCYDPKRQDSQAVYVGNTPGPIVIRGGRYSAGSEVVLFGGDATKIPNVTPTGILIEGAELFRPSSWMTDETIGPIKNIFELKNARDVVLRKSTLRGCWSDGQAGEAIMLTPDLDGDRKDPPLRSGEVVNVLVEDCTVTDCASVVNMAGRAYRSYTVNPLDGIVFRRLRATVSRAKYGGRGQLAILAGEPGGVLFDDCDFTGDGSSTIYYNSGDVIDPVFRESRLAGKVGGLTVTGNRLTVGTYGFSFNGRHNAALWDLSVTRLIVTDNQFSGSKAMQKVLPENTYA